MKKLIIIKGQNLPHTDCKSFRVFGACWSWIGEDDWLHCDIPKFKRWLEEQLK